MKKVVLLSLCSLVSLNSWACPADMSLICIEIYGKECLSYSCISNSKFLDRLPKPPQLPQLPHPPIPVPLPFPSPLFPGPGLRGNQDVIQSKANSLAINAKDEGKAKDRNDCEKIVIAGLIAWGTSMGGHLGGAVATSAIPAASLACRAIFRD